MNGLKIKIFADGADLPDMIAAYRAGVVKGFTTNPTLMRKAGITDYVTFAHDVLRAIPDLPISFEVFSDDHDEMESQARKISGWGQNVFVKIPITNTQGVTSLPLIQTLSRDGIQLNITAILTPEQVSDVAHALSPGTPAIVSVFAGRIADTGQDPISLMTRAAAIVSSCPRAQLLWASSRELLNIFHAERCGCHIITVTQDILNKLHLVGKDLSRLSLDTVKMFYDDARKAGFRL